MILGVWVFAPFKCGRLLAPVLAAQRAIVYTRAGWALSWEEVTRASVRNGTNCTYPEYDELFVYISVNWF